MIPHDWMAPLMFGGLVVFMLIGFTMLLIQGISELIKRIAVMRDLIPDPHAAQVNALEAEVEHIVEAIEKR